MLGHGSNQWAMDRTAAGESTHGPALTDEPMWEQSAADDRVIMQVRYEVELLTYQGKMATKRGCFLVPHALTAVFAPEGVLARGRNLGTAIGIPR